MKRGTPLRRAGLVLAVLVLAAIVTGVAASAAKTVIPKQLTGRWGRNPWLMVVNSSGEVNVSGGLAVSHAKFSRVTAHRLTVRGGPDPSCSGTGTYRWQVASGQLKLTKIHDACKHRVHLFAGIWLRRT